MASTEPSQSWNRAQVLRLVNITEPRLKGWERQQFVDPKTDYGFRDLIALRTLESLRSKKVSTQTIQRLLVVLRSKLRRVKDPLSAVKIFLEGKKLRAEIEGQKMEALSGQLFFDFEIAEVKRLVTFPKDDGKAAAKRQEQAQLAESEFWFQNGLDVEHKAGPITEAIAAYEKAIALNPNAAAAMVNLGTILFHQRKWTKAETQYRGAVTADPEYALAQFNLGNLFDERGDRTKAEEHYLKALKINPQYGDAHYNLALLYQGEGATMKAISHWRTYLKIDPQSDWSKVARRELDKLKRTMVSSGPQFKVHSVGGRD